jgi:hypothetical protein
MADDFKLSEPTTGTTFKAKEVGGKKIPGKILYDETGAAIDFAAIITALQGAGTQTTLAAILAKQLAAPSTEAKQDAGNTLLAAIGALLSTQGGYLDGIEGALAPLGTQTTLAAVLAKISSDPATQTSLAAFVAANHTDLAAILAKEESIRALIAGTLAVSAASLPLPTGAATQATLAALLAIFSGTALIGKVAPVDIASATRSDVSVTAASTLVLAANAARKPGSVIVCDTTAISYFKLGTGASATDYIAAVDGKTTVPGLFNVPDGYLGAVYGIGASATGSWRVTEMA